MSQIMVDTFFLKQIPKNTYQILKICQYATGVQLLKLNLRYYCSTTCLSEQNLYLFTKVSRDILQIQIHLKWIKKGNSRIIKSLSESRQLDRQAFSQLLVGVRNLYLDLEGLQNLLIDVSNEIDGRQMFNFIKKNRGAVDEIRYGD